MSVVYSPGQNSKGLNKLGSVTIVTLSLRMFRIVWGITSYFRFILKKVCTAWRRLECGVTGETLWRDWGETIIVQYV